MQHAGVIFAGS